MATLANVDAVFQVKDPKTGKTENVSLPICLNASFQTVKKWARWAEMVPGTDFVDRKGGEDLKSISEKLINFLTRKEQTNALVPDENKEEPPQPASAVVRHQPPPPPREVQLPSPEARALPAAAVPRPLGRTPLVAVAPTRSSAATMAEISLRKRSVTNDVLRHLCDEFGFAYGSRDKKDILINTLLNVRDEDLPTEVDIAKAKEHIELGKLIGKMSLEQKRATLSRQGTPAPS